MGLMLDTIIKWYNPDDPDEDGESIEGCEDGQCIGIIKEITHSDTSGVPLFSVRWWEKCEYHKKVDPNGVGPYNTDYLWQIGQL